MRNILKHRLFSCVNIFGLAFGLTINLLCFLLVSYEYSHDTMFDKEDRIFTVGSVFPEAVNGKMCRYPVPSVRTAYGPIIDQEITGVTTVARVLFRRYKLRTDFRESYEGIRFADPGFTQMFNFEYLFGTDAALNTPNAIIITQSSAIKYFGKSNVLGETILLSDSLQMKIGAVIEDLPPNSHFNSSLIADFNVTLITSLHTLHNLGDFTMAGEWNTLVAGDITYLEVSEGKDSLWLQGEIDSLFNRIASPNEIKTVGSLSVLPLTSMNTRIIDAAGAPSLQLVELFGLIILIIACFNYTNFATAQHFSRTREVVLRKIYGARRPQLLIQFMCESLTYAGFAMILALALIELIIPLYNDITGKIVTIDYFIILPKLIITTLCVGVLAGAYPAFIISRRTPVEGLNNNYLTGPKGGIFRGIMVGLQFSVTVFMLSMAMVIYFQIDQVTQVSNVFRKTKTVILDGIAHDSIVGSREVLRSQFLTIPGVKNVTFSNAVPFNEIKEDLTIQPPYSITPEFNAKPISVDSNFLQTFGIDIIAGEHLNTVRSIPDSLAQYIPVVVNELVTHHLGFDSPSQSIGTVFTRKRISDTSLKKEYKIIGVVPNQFFIGILSEIKPIVFYNDPILHTFASITLTGSNTDETLSAIDHIWKSVIPTIPIQRRFLDSSFYLFFRFFLAFKIIFTFLAVVSLILTFVNFFGLTALMTQHRTKEIGLRKVMGAEVPQIVRLLLWQFSRPILISMIFALPITFLVITELLQVFPNTMNYYVSLIVIDSIIALFVAWLIVAFHVYSIARKTPIHSLQYD